MSLKTFSTVIGERKTPMLEVDEFSLFFYFHSFRLDENKRISTSFYLFFPHLRSLPIAMSRSINEKSPDKAGKTRADSENETDLDEEEFIVEKILKMRTTKKGKVQCESNENVEKKTTKILEFFRSSQMERFSR